MDNNQSLIASIEAFDIDGGPVQTSFADRLAEEQGWTPEFTQRVIREYKRFVALAMISKTPVTPSLIVDEAWHLHLIYTRSYWERFMPMLPRPLHHEPTKGGEAEDSKHKNQFSSTLKLYRQTFGEEAPADIWLTNSPQKKHYDWKSLAAASGLLLAGCTTVAQINQPDFVIVFFGVVILFVGVWVVTVIAMIVASIFGATNGRMGGSPPRQGTIDHSSYNSSDSSSSPTHHGSCGSSGSHSSSHCGSGGHCSSHSGSSCGSSSSSSCSSGSSCGSSS